MIRWMLEIWSLVPLPFLKPAWTPGSSQLTYCWSLAWRILSITLLQAIGKQDPGFPIHRLRWYNSPSPDGKTIYLFYAPDQVGSPGVDTHMPHGKDFVKNTALARRQRTSTFVTSLYTDLLNLVNEVTNYPVKSECNIWNILILKKNLCLFEVWF